MNINRYQDCATTIEMENQSLRPAITKKLTNMEEYLTMKEMKCHNLSRNNKRIYI